MSGIPSCFDWPHSFRTGLIQIKPKECIILEGVVELEYMLVTQCKLKHWMKEATVEIPILGEGSRCQTFIQLKLRPRYFCDIHISLVEACMERFEMYPKSPDQLMTTLMKEKRFLNLLQKSKFSKTKFENFGPTASLIFMWTSLIWTFTRDVKC